MTEAAPTLPKTYSLSEVCKAVNRALEPYSGKVFWVRAEMHKLCFYKHSGHCYPEMVEKTGGRIVAQMRCTLWRDTYKRVDAKFIATLGEPLKDGIAILFAARIRFDAMYGLSLHIEDIDPAYTLGALAAQRAHTIQALKEQGLYDANHRLSFPVLPQRLALISVETSKGLQDFESKIYNNPEGFAFQCTLFPSLLQGDAAVASILRQLNIIRQRAKDFDAVAIIRGGGGEVGLACYNNLELCAAIAGFPIPVMTGIGHAANQTVAELVAARSFITPTDLANFLLQCFEDAAAPLYAAEELLLRLAPALCVQSGVDLQRLAARLSAGAQSQARTAGLRLSNKATTFRAAVRDCLQQSGQELRLSKAALRSGYESRMSVARADTGTAMIRAFGKDVSGLLQKHQVRLEHLRNTTELLHPRNVLRRGYSITRINGQALTDAGFVPDEAVLQTELFNGSIVSVLLESQPLIPQANGTEPNL